MATQLKSDELAGCKSYFVWLCEKIIPEEDRYLVINRGSGKVIVKTFLENIAPYHNVHIVTGKELESIIGSDKNKLESEFGRSSAELPSDVFEDVRKVQLCRFMYGVDFRLSSYEDFRCVEDETRATNGMELRRRYAESVGKDAGKSERDIDRIWKSVHGKCSVLELLIHLCNRLDEMTNEEESGKDICKFFDVFLENLEIDITGSIEDWQCVIDRFLDRKYNENGSGGGLFPIKNTVKDVRKMPIWDQLNTWLNEHLNEDAVFIWGYN